MEDAARRRPAERGAGRGLPPAPPRRPPGPWVFPTETTPATPAPTGEQPPVVPPAPPPATAPPAPGPPVATEPPAVPGGRATPPGPFGPSAPGPSSLRPPGLDADVDPTVLADPDAPVVPTWLPTTEDDLYPDQDPTYPGLRWVRARPAGGDERDTDPLGHALAPVPPAQVPVAPGLPPAVPVSPAPPAQVSAAPVPVPVAPPPPLPAPAAAAVVPLVAGPPAAPPAVPPVPRAGPAPAPVAGPAPVPLAGPAPAPVPGPATGPVPVTPTGPAAAVAPPAEPARPAASPEPTTTGSIPLVPVAAPPAARPRRVGRGVLLTGVSLACLGASAYLFTTAFRSGAEAQAVRAGAGVATTATLPALPATTTAPPSGGGAPVPVPDPGSTPTTDAPAPVDAEPPTVPGAGPATTVDRSAYSVEQRWFARAGDPPVEEFWGTAPAGTAVSVVSPYGRGETTAAADGTWRLDVAFRDAPVGTTFTGTVRVGDYARRFLFTRVAS